MDKKDLRPKLEWLGNIKDDDKKGNVVFEVLQGLINSLWEKQKPLIDKLLEEQKIIFLKKLPKLKKGAETYDPSQDTGTNYIRGERSGRNSVLRVIKRELLVKIKKYE